MFRFIHNSMDPDVSRILASMTTKPNSTRISVIATLVSDLKDAGLWTKAEALYLTAAADSQAAAINWVNPGTYDIVPKNTPGFTADLGFTGNNSTAYLDTQFVPFNGTKFTQNDASSFVWVTDTVSDTGSDTGFTVVCSGITTNLYIRPLMSTGGNTKMAFSISGTSHFDVALPEEDRTRLGFKGCTRTSSTLSTGYSNGVSLGGITDTSSLGVGTVRVLSNGGTNTTQDTVGFFWMGSSLTDSEVSDLYTAVNTYLTAVGAVE